MDNLAETIIFDVISSLTGGLITDVSTVIYGCLALMLITAGLAMISRFLGEFAQDRQFNAAYSAAQEFHELRSSADRGSVEYDFYNSQYRRALSASIRLNPAGPLPSSSHHEAGTGSDPFHAAPCPSTPDLAYDPGSDPGYYGYDLDDPGPSEPPRGF